MSVVGSFLHEYVKDGKRDETQRWRMGSIVLTDESIELIGQNYRAVVPVASVGAVRHPDFPVPAVRYPRRLVLHHLKGQQWVASLIAFPAITVQNFPLQLAGALTGTVRAFAPVDGGAMEEVRFRFAFDRFDVGRRLGYETIPLDNIANVEVEKRVDGHGRPLVEWLVDHVEGEALKRATFFSYDRLPFLLDLLQQVRQMRHSGPLGEGPKETQDLTEAMEQVAVMLYTGGMSTADIQAALGLSDAAIDRIYEDFLRRGLGKVVRVRKDIALTPAGIKAVDSIVKKQIQT